MATVGMFTPSAGDLSVQKLNDILGVGWQTALFHSATSHTVFSVLMQAFNSVCITAVSLLMIYVWITGIGQTAYEGELGGRSYHTIWTPIRISSAVSMLMPIPWASGYCLLQLIFMFLVSCSIGFADFGAAAVNQYLVKNAGQIYAPTPLRQSLIPTVKGALGAEVAGEYMRQRNNQGITYRLTAPGFFPDHRARPTRAAHLPGSIAPPDTTPGTYSIPVVTVGMPGGDVILGELTAPCSDKISMACTARLAAAVELYYELAGPSCWLVAKGSTAQAPCNPLPNQRGDAPSQREIETSIIIAENNYLATMTEAVKAATAAANGDIQDKLRASADEMDNQGWLALGAYFWTLHNAAAQVRQVANLSQGFSPAPVGTLYSHVYDPGGLQALEKRVGSIVGHLTSLATAVTAGRLELTEGKGGHKPADNRSWLEKLGGWFSTPETAMAVAAHIGDDPMGAMQSIGNGMMDVAEVGIGAYLIWRGGVAAVARSDSHSAWGVASSWIPGIGGPKEAAIGAVKGLTEGVGPFVTGMFCLLMTAGFVAGYVIPSIPSIVWLIAVMGWFFLVLEILIAAPIWMIGQAIPGGEGFLSEYAKKGVILLLEALLTPFLMVVGWYASIILLHEIGGLTGYLFQIAAASMQKGTVSGLFANFFLICIFIGTVGVIVTGCFRCTTIFRDKVMNWVANGGGSMTADTSAHTTAVLASARIAPNAAEGRLSGAAGEASRALKGGAKGALPSPGTDGGNKSTATPQSGE